MRRLAIAGLVLLLAACGNSYGDTRDYTAEFIYEACQMVRNDDWSEAEFRQAIQAGLVEAGREIDRNVEGRISALDDLLDDPVVVALFDDVATVILERCGE